MTGKKKILLIDDDPLVLESLEIFLKRAGYDVITAQSAVQGIKLAETSDFNLMISDIRMPGKNGVETAKEIQSKLIDAGKKSPLPIIFITGYAELSEEIHANFFGKLLYKPIDNDELLTAIRDFTVK